MTETRKLHPNRYTVVCKKFIFADYRHVDFKKCNEIAKRHYDQIVEEILVLGEYQQDELMTIAAMLVQRMGFEMTKQNPKNEWLSDGFPEFCSMIGPDSGLQVIERVKR